MPLSEKMDQVTVDSLIDLHLETLYGSSLSAETVILVLSRLIDPEANPPQIELKLSPYKANEIKNAIKELESRIRTNFSQTPGLFFTNEQIMFRNPETGELYRAGTTQQVSRSGAIVTDRDIHDYMRHKFAITAFSILALHETNNFIKKIKQDKGKNKQYCEHFTTWVVKDAMPEDMRQLLLSDGKLRKMIINAIIAKMSDQNFKIFIPYIDKSDLGQPPEQKESKEPEELNRPEVQTLIKLNDIIDHMLSWEPAVFDTELETAINIVLTGFHFEENRQVVHKILEESPYKEAREKLALQLNEPDENYFFAISVIPSFVKVMQTRESLNQLGDSHPNDAALISSSEKICEDFLKHLSTSTQDEQRPLDQETLNTLDRAREDIEFTIFCRDFFANYFAIENNDAKNNLYAKMLYYTFDREKIYIDDEWLQNINKRNTEEKGTVIIEPQHRNRIFMQALTMPIEKWSPSFHDTFNDILTLLENSTDPAVLREKESSYPPRFMRQLRGLQRIYIINTNENENHELRDDFQEALPMLYSARMRGISLVSTRPNSTWFSEVLCNLTPNALSKIDWPRLISNNNLVLSFITEKFSEDQLKVVFDYPSEQLLQMFNLNFFVILDDVKINIIFEIIKDRIEWNHLIKQSYEVIHIFRSSSQEKRNTIFSHIKNINWNGLISNPDDFNKIIDLLTLQQMQSVCSTITNDNWSKLFRTSYSFEIIADSNAKCNSWLNSGQMM